jgi:hypothetical protein
MWGPQLRRTLLAAAAKQTNEVYNLLNEAHERGELSPERAEMGLRSMSAILETWVDAINPP